MPIDPQTILEDSKSYADSLKSEIVDAMNRLESMASGRQTWIDFGTLTTFEPSKPVPLSADTLPSLEKAVLGVEFNDDPATIEKYKEHVFKGLHLDQLQEVLCGWIESGGVGISDSVQDALFNNMRERDLQALQDAIDAVKSTDAKRGFKYATHRRKTSEVILNYQQTKENRNREITALLADLAQKNVQYAITQDVAIEKLHADFALGLSQLFVNINNRVLDKFRVEQEARVAEFEAKMKVILAGYQLGETNNRLDLGYQELLANKWHTEVSVLTERTKALIQQAERETMVRLEAARSLAAGLSNQLSASLLQTNGIAVTTSKS